MIIGAVRWLLKSNFKFYLLLDFISSYPKRKRRILKREEKHKKALWVTMVRILPFVESGLAFGLKWTGNPGSQIDSKE